MQGSVFPLSCQPRESSDDASARGRVLDTIVLLTGAVEAPYLSARLREHRPSIEVVAVTSREELLAVPPEMLARARLVSFTTVVIVPGSVLAQLGFGAYNFHPGPPAYPGLMPAQLAIYRGGKEFGVTAHRMVERVDAGAIVGTILFPIPPNPTVEALEALAYGELLRLFWQLAPLLAGSAEPLAEIPLQWGPLRSTRRSIAALCDIPPDITREELDRRVSAFAGNVHGVVPTVTLHGHRFQLVADAAPAQNAEPERASLAG